MKGLSDELKHARLGKNIKMMHLDQKRKLFDDIMDETVDPDILTRGTILHKINACGMAFSSLYVGYSKARLISL